MAMKVVKPPKVLYAGQKNIGEKLLYEGLGTNLVNQGLQPWEPVAICGSLSELNRGIRNETISNEVEALIVLDNTFDPDGHDTTFENMICEYAPYIWVGILNFNPDRQDQMIERINETNENLEGKELNYFFIEPDEDILVRIDQSLEKFVQEAGPDAQDTVKILTGEETYEEQRARLEAEFEEDEPTEPEFEKGPLVSDSQEEEERETDKLGRIISVTSSKGGVGKSTVSMTLATFLGKQSKEAYTNGKVDRPLKVLLIDMDVYDAQVSFLAGLTNPTIVNIFSEYESNRGFNRKIIHDNILHADHLDIDVILASKRPETHRNITDEFYKELLTRLRKDYDYIILDTSVSYLESTLSKVCYPMSDKIVYVTEPVVTSIYSMTRWIRKITSPLQRDGLGIDSKKIVIALNKFLGKSSIYDGNFSQEEIRKAALGVEICTVIPSVPSGVNHSANMQRMDYALKLPGIFISIQRIARLLTHEAGYDL